MEIKGTAVKTTPDYVRQYHGQQFNDWLFSLPDGSRKIIENPIYATNWYNLTESVIVPTRKVGDLFFRGDHVKAAATLGRYSSEVALQGIYKIFVRVSSPHFVLSRATSIFSAYYRPSIIRVLESKDNQCVLEFKGFHPDEKLIMHRIAGWVEKTLEITLKTALRVDVENMVEGFGMTTRITAEWD